MLHVNFCAGEKFEPIFLQEIDTFVANYPDFQSVFLNNFSELNILFSIIGIEKVDWEELVNSPFSKYCDISNFKFPILTEEEFIELYKKWLEESKRENNMNEYGSLVFLEGISKQWNELKYRLIIIES